MKKILKKTFMFLLLCSFLTVGFGINNKAFAHVDKVANNTKDLATQLKCNTVQDSLTSNVKVLYGCDLIGADDEDWYKVSLPEGVQTLSIYATKSIVAEVYSADNNRIFKSDYGNSKKIGQRFTVNQAGTYYIKVISPNKENVNYYIMAGAPWYKSDSYTYNLNQNVPVSKYTKESMQVSFSLSGISSIPNSAVVTGVTIKGRDAGDASGRVRSVKAATQTSWINTKEFSFSNDSVFTGVNPTMLKQGWSFKHSVSTMYSSSYSVNPSITFNYMCEDDI